MHVILDLAKNRTLAIHHTRPVQELLQDTSLDAICPALTSWCEKNEADWAIDKEGLMIEFKDGSMLICGANWHFKAVSL